MNSLLYYYNNVQKMAAYRQAKRMQRGVRLGYNQSPTASLATGLIGEVVPIGVGYFSVEYFGNSYGSGAYPFLSSVSGTFSCRSASVGQNGVSSVIVGDSDDPIPVGWAAQSSESRFYLAVTRSGATVNVYINGELKATREQSEVKDLGDLQLAIANSSDVGFVRVWNYALSADDITAHYNNGDPMGYVVPKAMRLPEIEFPVPGHTESRGVFAPNSTSDTTRTIDIPQANGFSGSYMRFDAVTTISLYCAYFLLYLKQTSPIKITMEYRSNHDLYEGITPGNPGMLLASANEGDAKVIEVYYPSSIGKAYLGIAGKKDPDAWLETRVLSIETVGLLAEYLPQNLMYGRDDKSIATSWLDSAKQMPLSDEYMEPLFQSIGGYDMAAKGAPEILYNE